MCVSCVWEHKHDIVGNITRFVFIKQFQKAVVEYVRRVFRILRGLH